MYPRVARVALQANRRQEQTARSKHIKQRICRFGQPALRDRLSPSARRASTLALSSATRASDALPPALALARAADSRAFSSCEIKRAVCNMW